MRLFDHILICCLCGGALQTAPAYPLANSSFETGTLVGWQVSGWGGTYYRADDPSGSPVSFPFNPQANPYIAGVPYVTSQAAVDGLYGLWIEPPQLGTYAAFVGQDDVTYQFLRQNYGVTVGQDFWLDAGQTLEGWARFGSEDGSPHQNDYAQVSVNGTPVWYHDSGEFPGVSYDYRWLPWETWSFTAPASGLYQLNFSVYGDDQFSTYANFDLRVPVADAGSTLLFLAIAGLGVLACRRFQGRAANDTKPPLA